MYIYLHIYVSVRGLQFYTTRLKDMILRLWYCSRPDEPSVRAQMAELEFVGLIAVVFWILDDIHSRGCSPQDRVVVEYQRRFSTNILERKLTLLQTKIINVRMTKSPKSNIIFFHSIPDSIRLHSDSATITFNAKSSKFHTISVLTYAHTTHPFAVEVAT